MIRIKGLSSPQLERLGQEQLAAGSAAAGRPSYEDGAACSQVDPEVWFPEPGQDKLARAAKRVCRDCPVRAWCLMYAAEDTGSYGIWGGLTDRGRRKVRAKHPSLDPTRHEQPAAAA